MSFVVHFGIVGAFSFQRIIPFMQYLVDCKKIRFVQEKLYSEYELQFLICNMHDAEKLYTLNWGYTAFNGFMAEICRTLTTSVHDQRRSCCPILLHAAQFHHKTPSHQQLRSRCHSHLHRESSHLPSRDR